MRHRGGGLDASGPMSWIARAGGHKVAIRRSKRAGWRFVPAKMQFFEKYFRPFQPPILRRSLSLFRSQRRRSRTTPSADRDATARAIAATAPPSLGRNAAPAPPGAVRHRPTPANSPGGSPNPDGRRGAPTAALAPPD